MTVTVKGVKNFNPRDLTKPYLMGYNEIIFLYNDSGVVHRIQDEVASLLGFEIVKSDSRSCLVRNIAQGIEHEFDNILNRLMFLLITAGEELYEGITQNDREKIEQVIAKEKESNKLSLFCRRMLNLRSSSSDKNQFILYTLATLLEGALDEFRFIAQYHQAEHPSLTKKTIQFLSYINSMNHEFYILYKKFDNEKFLEFRKKRKEAEKTFANYNGLTSEDAYIISKLYNIQELVHHMTYF